MLKHDIVYLLFHLVFIAILQQGILPQVKDACIHIHEDWTVQEWQSQTSAQNPRLPGIRICALGPRFLKRPWSDSAPKGNRPGLLLLSQVFGSRSLTLVPLEVAIYPRHTSVAGAMV